MLETILNERVIFVLMGTLAVVGILSKCVVNVTLKRLVKAAGNMNKSTHPLMRLVRAKFEHASMVSDKVENVKVFVDKYLYEYKVLGMRLHGLGRLEKMSAGLCLICGAAGAGLEYSVNGPGDMVWQTGAAGAGLAVLVYLVHLSTDEKYQMEVIQNYMVDYLENVCRHRYEKEKTNQKGLKVLTQEGIQTDFGVMPDEETVQDIENNHIDENDSGEEYSGEKYLGKKYSSEKYSDEKKYVDDELYAVKKRETESKRSAVDTFHAAELIADEAISAFRAAEARKQKNADAHAKYAESRAEKPRSSGEITTRQESDAPEDKKTISQSNPMGEILAAEAKRGESAREVITELPAAEFDRETMEPARMERSKAARREKAEEELDRDIVIRRILEEFMA